MTPVTVPFDGCLRSKCIIQEMHFCWEGLSTCMYAVNYYAGRLNYVLMKFFIKFYSCIFWMSLPWSIICDNKEKLKQLSRTAVAHGSTIPAVKHWWSSRDFSFSTFLFIILVLLCLKSLFEALLPHEKQQANEEVIKRGGLQTKRACRLALPGVTPSEQQWCGLLLLKFKLLLHSRVAGICLNTGEKVSVICRRVGLSSLKAPYSKQVLPNDGGSSSSGRSSSAGGWFSEKNRKGWRKIAPQLSLLSLHKSSQFGDLSIDWKG